MTSLHHYITSNYITITANDVIITSLHPMTSLHPVTLWHHYIQQYHHDSVTSNDITI